MLLQMLCFLALFFSISVFFYNSIGVFRAEYALVIIVIVIFPIRNAFRVAEIFKVEMTAMMVVLFLSMFGLIRQAIGTGAVSEKDFMLIPRISFYLSCFILSGYICVKRRHYTNVSIFLYVFGGAILFITVSQYYDLFGINQLIQPYAPNKIDRMDLLVEQAGWRRAVGTLGNPNYWGLLISMLSCFVSYFVFWQKYWRYVPLLLSLIGSIVLTGSRAAMVAYLGSLIIGAILFWFECKKKPSLIVVALLSSVAILFIAPTDLSSNVETSNRYSLENLQTLQMRVDVWRRILDEMSREPVSFIVGQGTRKTMNIIGYADNAYIKIFREHGLIGLVPYLFLLAFMIWRTITLYRTIDEVSQAWPGGLCMGLLAWVLFDFSADTWYGPRLMGVILVWYAFVHTIGANRTREKSGCASVTAADRRN